MSGKTKKRNAKKELTAGVDASLHAAIVDGVAKMLKKHGAEIRELLSESEQNMASISFPVKIDGSEAETTIKTGITFSSRVSDSVTARLDDPNQGQWEEITNPEPKSKDEPEGEEDPA